MEDDTETQTPLPCPFCGEVPGSFYMDQDQGYKWGGVECCSCRAHGPEVRTGYDQSPDAAWHQEAIERWNHRIRVEREE